MSSSLTLCPSRSGSAQFSRSDVGVQNGVPRRAGPGAAELCHGRDEGELARAQRSRPLRTLAARLTAHRAPLPENPNCAQVYAYTGRFTGNHSSFVDFQQCRASLQPAQARQGGSASFSGRPSRARQHITACDCGLSSSGRSLHRIQYGAVRVQQMACNLLMAEYQYGMTALSLCNATVAEGVTCILSVLRWQRAHRSRYPRRAPPGQDGGHSCQDLRTPHTIRRHG